MHWMRRISRAGCALVLSLGLVGGAAVVSGSAAAGTMASGSVRHPGSTAAMARHHGRHGANRCRRNRIDVPKCGML
jgi:hypothetical protein